MSREYLRSFVIGSSFLVFFPFFYIVSQMNPSYRNYSYVSYTFVAPVFLGFANMFSLFLQNTFDLSKENRLLSISLLAPTILFSYVMYSKAYTKVTISYPIYLFLLYFIVWNFVVYSLDSYI
jgi:hypothetical protein